LGGSDDDANLVYSCPRCNSYKSDYWHDEVEHRLLHPLNDPVNEHLEEDRITGILTAKTERGILHLEKLHLNRPQLIQQRLLRHLLATLTQRNETLERENTELRELVRLLTDSL
jgi:hypothetical protein